MPAVFINADRCKSCGLCVDACPKKIMVLSKEKMNAKGFHPAEVTKQDDCIGCANCAVMCPDTVITITK